MPLELPLVLPHLEAVSSWNLWRGIVHISTVQGARDTVLVEYTMHKWF